MFKTNRIARLDDLEDKVSLHILESEKRFADLEMIIEKLEEWFKNVQALRESLERKESELESFWEERGELFKDVQNLKESISKMKSFEKEKSEFIDDIKSLRESLERKESELREIRKDIHELKSSIPKAKIESKPKPEIDIRPIVDELNAKIVKVEERMESNISSLENEMMDLNSIITGLTREVKKPETSDLLVFHPILMELSARTNTLEKAIAKLEKKMERDGKSPPPVIIE